MKELDGASRCPVCDREPVIILDVKERMKDVVTLKCHEYSGEGLTLNDAVRDWNQRVIPAREFMSHVPADQTTSPCWNCKTSTKSRFKATPKRYYTECCGCNLVKHEDMYSPLRD